MITVRAADWTQEKEKQRIAAFVAGHPQGSPFHLPAWSLAVAEGCGQTGHYLLAERGDGSLVGVLPLTHIRSLLFGKVLVSSGFAVDGGVLAEDEAAVAPLIGAGRALAEKLGCASMELRGGPAPGEGWHSDFHTYLGFARDLAVDDEAELKRIPRKQRAEVRKALAQDFTVATGVDAVDTQAHYRVYAESVRNLGTPVFPRALFAAVLREFGEAADVLVIRHRGEAVASVLSLYWRECVYPYWGGGTRSARGLRANDALYFVLMRHARARGCTRFDFGRSKAGTGAAAFKKNWGFEGKPLAYHHHTAAGAAPRSVNPLNPKYRLQVAAWKRLPLPLANWLGPHLSRGLG